MLKPGSTRKGWGKVIVQTVAGMWTWDNLFEQLYFFPAGQRTWRPAVTYYMPHKYSNDPRWATKKACELEAQRIAGTLKESGSVTFRTLN